MSRARGVFRAFLGLTAIFACVAAALAAYWYLGSYNGFGPETFVQIEHGMSSRDIARELAQHGVVRSPWSFLVIRMLHPRAALQAGEYRFGAGQTPWQVFDEIRRGQIFYEDFTVPEGSNIFDIASLLENSHTVQPAAFLKAAANPESVRDLDPKAPSLEGYLFPSTYRVTHSTTAEQLCRMMTSEFRRQFQALGERPYAPDYNTHRIVTLASLVEKETAVPAERPVIAAIFLNRLRLNMPLQCDPTTVYAALSEKRYRGVIHRSDLTSVNPYNTYAHPGLPPGPIANPGIAALKAALDPAPTDYLYFVAKADGSGSHQFSSTLTEHQKAVLAYRKAGH